MKGVMARRVVPLSLCLSLGHLLSVSVAVVNPIQLPSGRFSLSTVDNSEKNSGADGGSLSADALGPTGYMNYQAIAPNRGLQLASAASAIRSINKTAAAALEAEGQKIASGGNAAFAGLAAYTQSLGTYLTYHGGKTMALPNNFTVYLIFYGKWSKKQRAVVRDFVLSLGPAGRSTAPRSPQDKSPLVADWWAINTKYYYNIRRKFVTPNVHFGAIYNDKGSMATLGTKANPLTHKHVQAIVSRAVDPRRRNHLPLNPNAGYAVMTDAETHLTDFCQGLCAYHTSASFYGTKLAYTFVGNPAKQCPLFCTYRYFDPMYAPPNGDLGADAIADKLGHELAEIATNALHGPNDVAGWSVGNSNVENADLCEWEYGRVTYEKDMRVWNLRGIGERRFLVQKNFNPIKRQCVLQWSE